MKDSNEKYDPISAGVVFWTLLKPQLCAEKQNIYAVKQKQFTPNVEHELFYEIICFYDDWRGAV